MRSKFGLILAGLVLLLSGSIVQAGDKGSEMVQIPAGEFIMGLTLPQTKEVANLLKGQSKRYENTTPQRKVKLEAYFIDKYEATNTDYKKFMDATGHNHPVEWDGNDIPAGKEKHPVVGVSWFDTEAYCKWAGKRLPTEAEWEKAARGQDGRFFPWGKKFDRRRANIASNGTKAVGKYKKGISPYGVHDMTGNVWEWTADNYLAYPGNTIPDEFYGNDRYVARGGSWFTDSFDAVSIFREKYSPNTDFDDVGIRCVR